jgi:hypothetical protein
MNILLQIPFLFFNCPQKYLQHENLLFEIVLTFIFGLHAAMQYDQLRIMTNVVVKF